MKRALLILLVLLSLPALSAAIPQLITYQGMLTASDGAPAAGSRSIAFSLYTSASGGTAVWGETQPVTVANGIYSVPLGAATPIPASVFTADTLYLGIAVVGEAEMTPRQRVTSVGYAFRAATADSYAGPPLADSQISSASYWNSSVSYLLASAMFSVATTPPLTGSGTPASPLGIAAGTYAANNDPRLSDARNPLPGSPGYIQNGTTPQTASFNISGNATIGGDLNVGGQIAPLRVQNSATSPSPASAANAGQLYFDTVNQSLMISDGTSWVSSGGRRVFYATGNAVGDDTDNGFVAGRSVTFTKAQASSRLRVTYSDNLRVLSTNACQWEIYVDGSPANPQIKTALYGSDTGITHRQSTLVGYLTNVAAGTHQVQVKATTAPGYTGANCYTGWQSTFLLEVEELL